MIASTFSLSLFTPSKELIFLVLPSKLKGRVTMARTKAPFSLAHFATIGAAPVPVPPPSPQAIKTISEPFTTAEMSL